MSQPERAPDPPRGPGLGIYLSILREAMAAAEPRTLSEVFADRLDALLAAREGDGYAGIANDLVRELAAARDRIAALEKALAKEELQGKIEQAETRLRTLERALEKSHRRMMAHAPLAWVGQCFACDALAPTVGRPALDYGVHAGLNTGFASGCAATWEELQDGKCHEPGHWTPPTAGRSAS